eukprot:TRINITY_DN3889_c0_g2_i10.p1 TRINITY_DN3889_c0_g2~~TRINITY_DN3889_c0_g2_i10.p1  ORF type:complete len:498 (+),score=46.54 TRINITY_DN3889_c0_g2_i10:254-1747(+)
MNFVAMVCLCCVIVNKMARSQSLTDTSANDIHPVEEQIRQRNEKQESTDDFDNLWKYAGEENSIIVSVPANTNISVQFQYENGTQTVSHYPGPDAQFLSLNGVASISITPVKSTDYQEKSTFQTLILPEIVTNNKYNDTMEELTDVVDSEQQYSDTQVNDDIYENMWIPRVYSTTTAFTVPLYDIDHDQQVQEIAQIGGFTTIANVFVDQRSPSVITPDQNYTTSSPVQLPMQYTFQRGLPQTFEQQYQQQVIENQSDFRQQVYSQLQNLEVSQIQSDFQAPGFENTEQQYEGEEIEENQRIMQHETTQVDLQIRQVQDEQEQGSLQRFLQQGYGSSMQDDKQEEELSIECASMEELILENGGELFLEAMKVSQIDLDDIGKIISIFLPNSTVLQQKLNYNNDFHNQAQIQELILSHIVPDLFLINLDITTSQNSAPLNTANLTQFTIQKSNFNQYDSNNDDCSYFIQPYNVQVLSATPQFACEGFLFLLDGILIFD